jgi:hypothetical protein
MDKQRENQLKQHKENLERQYEQQQRLAPVRVQDAYNKENLETQHKHNLEIFEKQAELTREMQKKQRNLTITLIIITALATIAASILSPLFTTYLSGMKQHTAKAETIQRKPETSTQTNPPQYAKPQAVVRPEPKTKPLEQEVISSKDVSSKKTP